MPTATLIRKGQITVPKEVRDYLHLSEGDRVEFLIEPEGKVELRPNTRSIQSLFGILHRPGMRPVTVEEMDEAVGRYLAEEDERIRRGRGYLP